MPINPLRQALEVCAIELLDYDETTITIIYSLQLLVFGTYLFHTLYKYGKRIKVFMRHGLLFLLLWIVFKTALSVWFLLDHEADTFFAHGLWVYKALFLYIPMQAVFMLFMYRWKQVEIHLNVRTGNAALIKHYESYLQLCVAAFILVYVVLLFSEVYMQISVQNQIDKAGMADYKTTAIVTVTAKLLAFGLY